MFNLKMKPWDPTYWGYQKFLIRARAIIAPDGSRRERFFRPLLVVCRCLLTFFEDITIGNVDKILACFVKPDELVKKIYELEGPKGLEKVCIFSHFNKKGTVAPFCVKLLESVSNCGFEIQMVSLSEIDAAGLEKIRKRCSKVTIKENVGRDFGAYYTGVKACGIAKRKCLLLMNDSMYGPFFPLVDVFSSMKERGYDICGVIALYDDMGYYIQSHFLLFNEHVLHSKDFDSFISKIKHYAYVRNTILYQEVGLSKYFMKKRYNIGALISARDIWDKETCFKNPTIFCWKELITEHHYPFIKRRILANNVWHVDTSDWREVVSSASNYDLSLIERELSSTK